MCLHCKAVVEGCRRPDDRTSQDRLWAGHWRACYRWGVSNLSLHQSNAPRLPRGARALVALLWHLLQIEAGRPVLEAGVGESPFGLCVSSTKPGPQRSRAGAQLQDDSDPLPRPTWVGMQMRLLLKHWCVTPTGPYGRWFWSKVQGCS